ncbi:MAG: diphosphate--fructose-6-phosphate 1-phosphotransferase [Lachnospiraceae bacterium]|nr:diphosphate--fructose-6-phosphate 1-phosphotransferase [Lachnospiraceae bacterium]
MGNMLIVHGGGPTAVMNASLYGVIRAARESGRVEHLYGAIGGTEAILKEAFVDLLAFSEERLSLLLSTPASAIGSSRYPLEEKDYLKMPVVFRKYGIEYVLLNGGNGTMDACGHIYRTCQEIGVKVIGIPKTIDNDIALTDHAPGYGSAARYIAATVHEIAQDVRALPIHVCVVEAMGRNAGWIAAASALARTQTDTAPDLIYLPERVFNEEEFLRDVQEVYDRKGYAVVVASEGLANERGESIVEPIYQTDRAVYYGDVSSHLAMLVIKKLGIKARSEKPGIAGRASIAWQSAVDREEAVCVGKFAVQSILAGENGGMVALVRKRAPWYDIEYTLVPVEQVMLFERKMPDEYINEKGNDVTDAFVEWCRPLVGEALPEFLNFRDCLNRK